MAMAKYDITNIVSMGNARGNPDVISSLQYEPGYWAPDRPDRKKAYDRDLSLLRASPLSQQRPEHVADCYLQADTNSHFYGRQSAGGRTWFIPSYQTYGGKSGSRGKRRPNDLNPKTIDQIPKETETEQMMVYFMNHSQMSGLEQSMKSHYRGGGGGGDGCSSVKSTGNNRQQQFSIQADMRLPKMVTWLSGGATAKGGKITQSHEVGLSGQASEKRTFSQNVSESQNYTPQGERTTLSNTVGAFASDIQKTINRGVENSPEAAPGASSNLTTNLEHNVTVDPSPSAELVKPALVAETRDENEFAVLSSFGQENISQTGLPLWKKLPPTTLEPLPPRPLSQQVDEGSPSTAGPATARINYVADRLGDSFRSMLIETLEDLQKSSEATIANLKLEIESLKYQHRIEISEIRKKNCTVLKNLQKSLEGAIDETIGAASESEAVKRLEEAKSKQ